jgi:hypothetical protein
VTVEFKMRGLRPYLAGQAVEGTPRWVSCCLQVPHWWHEWVICQAVNDGAPGPSWRVLRHLQHLPLLQGAHWLSNLAAPLGCLSPPLPGFKTSIHFSFFCPLAT